ncbi:lysis system i-spanin subunit Rz, partial [Xenorhabdus cabanillasii]|uniref:lysis system i-spanin subunit Rz n=1 Tax=Xenorhabdus cabanillasii TaxID=351673 RepID=UPI002B40100F
MNTLTKALTAICAVLVLGLWWVNDSYSELKGDYRSLLTNFNEQTTLITNQQERIQHLAELDSKHIQELANAKSEIDTLRADVAAGRRKLRIKA